MAAALVGPALGVPPVFCRVGLSRPRRVPEAGCLGQRELPGAVGLLGAARPRGRSGLRPFVPVCVVRYLCRVFGSPVVRRGPFSDFCRPSARGYRSVYVSSGCSAVRTRFSYRPRAVWFRPFPCLSRRSRPGLWRLVSFLVGAWSGSLSAPGSIELHMPIWLGSAQARPRPTLCHGASRSPPPRDALYFDESAYAAADAVGLFWCGV